MTPTSDMIDDAISRWHRDEDVTCSLAEYLGWTDREYNEWVRNAEAVPDRPLGGDY